LLASTEKRQLPPEFNQKKIILIRPLSDISFVHYTIFDFIYNRPFYDNESKEYYITKQIVEKDQFEYPSNKVRSNVDNGSNDYYVISLLQGNNSKTDDTQWYRVASGELVKGDYVVPKKTSFWELFEFITSKKMVRDSVSWVKPAVKFDSYMIEYSDLLPGCLRLLEVNNRLVLPVHTHIRLLVTSADVIHSWAVPSLGVKVDGIPGRLNQTGLFINRPGIFYGQCSELCGVNHGFMPIVVEAVDYETFAKWVRVQSNPKSLEELLNSPDWKIEIN